MNTVIPPSRSLVAFCNGRIVPKQEASVNLDTVAFKYGAMVFEGVRAYWNDEQKQLYAFRLDDHSHRLEDSVRVMRMETGLAAADFSGAVLATLQANEIREGAHVRQMVYVDGPGEMFALGPISHAVVVTPKGGLVFRGRDWSPCLGKFMAADQRQLAPPENQVRRQLSKRPDGFDAGSARRLRRHGFTERGR